MSSSSWASKLESRLSALADAASRESLQTLAKWIGFNRKHGAALAGALLGAIQISALARKRLYVQVLHHVLLLEHDDKTKWDRLLDLRILLGETVVLPALEMPDLQDVVTPLVDEWDQHNVFGGPKLMTEIRKALSGSPSDKDEDSQSIQIVETETESNKEDMTEAIDDVMPAIPENEPVLEQPESPKEIDELEVDMSERHKLDSFPKSTETVHFDFEREGIPFAKVDARDFLEPCKAIATLQIARDLRNDMAVQLSSRLSSGLPEEVQQICRDKAELTPSWVQEWSMKLPEELLDLDVEESIQNVETLLELMKQQREARRKLIHLLIQSRCQFGSDEAAEAFNSVSEITENLQTRKGLLVDAMELEGLDMEVEKDDEKKEEEALEPLTWYNPSDAKRAKLQK